MSVRRSDLRRRLDALAFGQAGYFSAAQALEVGYSYQAQRYHVEAGNWLRIDRGLFRLPSWPSAPEDQWVRWTLWSRGLGVVSHQSALQVHELSDVDPAVIHLTVPASFRAADPLVHTHHGMVGSEDRQQRAGWSVTTPLRTLVDAAGGDIAQDQIDLAVAQALDRGLTTRRAILRRTADASERSALRLERALTHAMERA